MESDVGLGDDGASVARVPLRGLSGPLLGIELDDDSHDNDERRKRDMFVNALFASTGVPLVRIHVRDMGKMEDLVAQLTRAWEHRWQLLSEAAHA